MTRKWQGMNWIRQEKRLAIYLRDGMACAWCGKGVEQGATLSLDHLTPHAKGGENHESNLVTCCTTCNSARGKRSQIGFARAVAQYINHGVTAVQIMAHVNRVTCRSLKPHMNEARDLIARRGSAAKALASM
jgi:hypothetical protein